MFIDRHRIADIDPAVRRQLQFEAEHALRDQTGTLPLGHWVQDGTIYCIIEAPDADAVCRHHRQRAVACDDLHELSGTSAKRPLSGEDRAVIMAAIRHLWPVAVASA